MEKLFKRENSLHTVFQERFEQLRGEIAEIPCNKINGAEVEAFVQQLIHKYRVAVPAFDPTPLKATLDESGTRATYQHRVENGENLVLSPSSTQVVYMSYDIKLRTQMLEITIKAEENSETTKRNHAQLAKAFAENAATLAREIEQRNPSFEQVAAQALAARRADCENRKSREAGLI